MLSCRKIATHKHCVYAVRPLVSMQKGKTRKRFEIDVHKYSFRIGRHINTLWLTVDGHRIRCLWKCYCAKIFKNP